MFTKMLAITALGLMAVIGSAQKTLIINRVLINAPKVGSDGSDDNKGQELFEIKNTGSSQVDLTGVALVIIDNELGENAELDGYYKFSGTLNAGATLTIRDGTASGSSTTVTAGGTITAPNGTTPGTITNYEFFTTSASKNAPGTDLSNSGGNYILVDGFQEARFSSLTFGSSKLSTDNDNTLDFLETGATTDDLWTTPLDAICTYPDGDEYGAGVQDQYITTLGLSSEHAIVAQATLTDDWTADYLFRMYRVDSGGTKVYDRFLQADVNALSGTAMTFDTTQFAWDDGVLVTAGSIQDSAGTAFSATLFPTIYVAVSQGGNFTSWGSFDHVAKPAGVGSLIYKH